MNESMPAPRPASSHEKSREQLTTLEELIPGTDTTDLISDENLQLLVSTRESSKIMEGTTGSNPAAFADYIYSDWESRTPLQEAFKDQVVIDLGAGMSPSGYLIADRAGAKGYIGVDLYHSARLAEMIESLRDPESHIVRRIKEAPAPVDTVNVVPLETKYLAVEEDMLTFLKRLPDKSVSVLCSGIDFAIIKQPYYEGQVIQEIKRVLRPEGSYVGGDEEHIVPNPGEFQVRSTRKVAIYRPKSVDDSSG